MTNLVLSSVLVFSALGAGMAQEDADRQPLTFFLDCAGGDCPLLKGAPQTSGMRSGAVKLRPGQSVGWHTTGEHEEALVILHGTGAANISGRADVPLYEEMLPYIPPRTKHNVTNTGTELLEYVWVVAPAGKESRGIICSPISYRESQAKAPVKLERCRDRRIRTGQSHDSS